MALTNNFCNMHSIGKHKTRTRADQHKCPTPLLAYLTPNATIIKKNVHSKNDSDYLKIFSLVCREHV